MFLMKCHGHCHFDSFLRGAQNRKCVDHWLGQLRWFCSSSPSSPATAGGAADPFSTDRPTTTTDRPQQRALRVAVIGSPNVGKSALTNALVRTNVCAVSSLIDTTRRNTVTTLTEDMCQLMVVDSPGLIGTGHARRMAGVAGDEILLSGPTHAIERAEHILVVHDVTMPGKYLSHRVLYFLHRFSHIPACLVLNKVDLITDWSELLQLAHTLTEGTVGGEPMKTERVKLGKLGAIIARNRKASSKGGTTEGTKDTNATIGGIHPEQRAGRDEEWHRLYNQLISQPAHKASWAVTRKLFANQLGWPNFSALFFVSAARGDGIDALRHHLRSMSQRVDKWRFASKAISTSDPRILCAEHTRSALLNRFPGYVAYALRTRITDWELSEEGMLRVAVDVFCDKERWVRLVGRVAEEIEREQCQLLAQLFSMPVQLRLFVRGPDRKRRFFDAAAAAEQLEHGGGKGMDHHGAGRQQQQEDEEAVVQHMTFEQQVMISNSSKNSNSRSGGGGGGRGGGDAKGRRGKKRF